MKKAIYYAGIVAMMLASCAKEQAEPDSVRNGNEQEFQGTVVTIQAALGSQETAEQNPQKQNAATKTTQTDGNFSWTDGEQISVGTSDGEYVSFKLVSAANGTFTHTFPGDVPELQMAISPVQSGSYAGTDDFQVSLPTVYNGYVSGTTNALLIGTPETENKFLFHHAAALIKVTYNNVPDGTSGLVLEANQNIASTSGIPLSSTDDVIESDNAALNSSSVRINLASAVSAANQSLVFYVPVPVGEYTGGLNIYLLDSSGNKIDRSEKTSNKSFTLARKEIFATPGIPVDITIDPVTVGNTNNTSTFGNDNGQVYTIPAGKRLNLIFENHSNEVEAWNNWVFYNVYNSTGHFVRADSYARIDNGAERVGSFTPGGSYSTSMLNGATVTATIDYYASGSYVLNVSAVNGNTTGTLKYTYRMTANLASITTQLRSDGSHYVMKDAWLEDAPEVVEDSDLSSITISNGPETIYLNQYIKDCGLTVTATFADGTTKDITADATYNPEKFTSVVDNQWVIISYQKTKLGNPGAYQQALHMFAHIVAAPPVSIAVTKAPTVTTYYYTDKAPSTIDFRPGGMVVTSTDSAGGTATVSSGLTYSAITKEEGPQDVTITYTSGNIVLTTTQSITLVKGTGLGEQDYSTAFGTVLSEKQQKVDPSSSVSFTFDVYANSPVDNNWESPVVVLYTDTDVYLRTDHLGWYAANPDRQITSGLTSNWNWETFKAGINKSRFVVTVTNNGNNTATVRMDVTYADGTVHYQQYSNVTVNSSKLEANITCEKNYLVFPPSE